MRLQRVDTHPREIKRLYVGGPAARAIYAPEGLADKLRQARHHNTADRTMSSIGRPPANDDGTRSYKLALDDDADTRCPECGVSEPGFIDFDTPDCPVSCEECGHETTLGVWRAEADSSPERCPDCHCPVDGDGQTVVDDLQVTCPCGCHERYSVDPTKNHGTDSGSHHTLYTARQEERDGRTVWRVYVGASTLPMRQDLREILPIWRWGDTSGAAYRLALDLVAHVTGDDELALEVFESFCRVVISRLPEDGWHMDAQEVRAAVEAIKDSDQDQIAFLVDGVGAGEDDRG